MKGLLTLVLCLCVPTVAIADDRLVLEEGAELESTHRIENATSAAVTAGLLGYESVQLIRWGYETKTGGGYDNVAELGKRFEYGLGTLAGIASISMAGLALHDILATPVADARDAYRAGDHTAGWSLDDKTLSSRQRGLRMIAWFSLVLDTGLAAYGVSQLGNDQRHDLGVANLWVGGTCALVSATILLHTREPVETRTHRRLAFSASPGGISVAGRF